jgi:hypothetical protein
MGEASNKVIADFSTMVNTILDEQAIKVGGMSGPVLAHAIQDGTREIWENMERMAQRVGVPLGDVADRPSCPNAGQTHMAVASLWWYLSCHSPAAMAVSELYTPTIMEPMVAWQYCQRSPTFEDAEWARRRSS